MDDREITALANGLAPFVRECVAEFYRKAAVPPELAGLVASAVRMLHESPPIEQRHEAPRPPPRVARIERDENGNYVPIYDEAQS